MSTDVENNKKTLCMLDNIINVVNEYCQLFEFYDRVYDPKCLYEDYKSKYSEPQNSV